MPEAIENIGAGEGNRTLVFSLEGCCSTIELHPRTGRSPITPGKWPQPLCAEPVISAKSTRKCPLRADFAGGQGLNIG